MARHAWSPVPPSRLPAGAATRHRWAARGAWRRRSVERTPNSPEVASVRLAASSSVAAHCTPMSCLRPTSHISLRHCPGPAASPAFRLPTVVTHYRPPSHVLVHHPAAGGAVVARTTPLAGRGATDRAARRAELGRSPPLPLPPAPAVEPTADVPWRSAAARSVTAAGAGERADAADHPRAPSRRQAE